KNSPARLPRWNDGGSWHCPPIIPDRQAPDETYLNALSPMRWQKPFRQAEPSVPLQARAVPPIEEMKVLGLRLKVYRHPWPDDDPFPDQNAHGNRSHLADEQHFGTRGLYHLNGCGNSLAAPPQHDVLRTYSVEDRLSRQVIAR